MHLLRPQGSRGAHPACVRSCLGRVRVFGDLSDPESAASKLLARNASQTLMSEDDGGGAGVHYIGLDVTGLRDYGHLEGGKAVDPQDFEEGKISQTTGPVFEGWTPNRMLKKSFHGFFSNDLSEVNSAKSHKLLGFLSLAIWQSILGLPGGPARWVGRAVFQQPAKTPVHGNHK